MTLHDYQIVARDPDGSPSGPVVGGAKLDLLLRYDDVGTIGPFSLPAESPSLDLLQDRDTGDVIPGAGLIVLRDDERYVSGIFDVPEATMDSRSTSGPPPDPFPGTVTLTCPDDLVFLRDRAIYPSPALPWESQADAYDIRTGPAESVIRGYVAANTTTTAGRPERWTILTQTPDQGRGRTVQRQSRFLGDGGLLTLCQVIAESAGLGFRALQGPSGPVFDVYVPVDRSDEVTFSYERNNLTSWTYNRACSTGNAVLLAAGGALVNRKLREAINADSVATWGRRVETFVDRRDTTDDAQIADALAEAIAANPDTLALEITVTDSAQIQFGRDYNLGDIVSVVFGSYKVTAVVRQVAISVDEHGVETVTPTLGSSGAGGAPDLLDLRKIRTRLGRQEAI